jgi:acetyl-CoA synthetase
MSLNEALDFFEPSAEFVKQATISGMDAYKALCAEAEKDYTGYWGRLAREHISWKQPFTQVLDESNAPFFKWFADGKLNASYNCLDRNVEAGLGDKVAIVFEADDGEVKRITYKELLSRVSQFANGLRSRGIKKGDRVLIYMSMGVEGIVAMQACARIGAIHSVVFGGFSAQSVRDRVNDAGAVAVITADEQCRKVAVARRSRSSRRWTRGLRWVAASRSRTSSFSSVPVAPATWSPIVTSGGTMWSPASRKSANPNGSVPSTRLFLLYTSGSTGKPKGVQHSTGGYLLHAMLTMKWTFDIKPDDLFWCTADIGWVTGHTYITYGPLACGATEDGLRRDSNLPGCRSFLENDPGPQGQHLLHGADGHPLAGQGGRRQSGGCPDAVRSLVAAPAGYGWRTDQPRCLAVVLQQRWWRSLPDR